MTPWVQGIVGDVMGRGLAGNVKGFGLDVGDVMGRALATEDTHPMTLRPCLQTPARPRPILGSQRSRLPVAS